MVAQLDLIEKSFESFQRIHSKLAIHATNEWVSPDAENQGPEKKSPQLCLFTIFYKQNSARGWKRNSILFLVKKNYALSPSKIDIGEQGERWPSQANES